MYRYQYELFKDEAVYIAGPECFYTHGFSMLNAMRRRAESLGFHVTLPNDNPLDMDNENLQKRADSIFEDLKADINQTTVIISDLEAYRGAEADSGTIYEIGMAYAKGAKSYGYTRDKRSLAAKNQGGRLVDGVLYDERGGKMPYADLPFSPCIIGSTKIVEGDFDDCLHTCMVDLEEEYKNVGLSVGKAQAPVRKREQVQKQPVVYLAGFERYEADGDTVYAKMKDLCRQYGFQAVSPLDPAEGVKIVETNHPYIRAANQFDHWQQHVRDCDIVIANLNNYRGYEISNDVGFECGMGFQLGKKLYGYMDDAGPLIGRIPHRGAAAEYRDQSGSNVENFNYPANLMFACSMTILEGKFEDIIKSVSLIENL